MSTLINALLPAAVFWVLDVKPPQSLTGQNPIWVAMILASGLATLVMTLILTLIIRKRIVAGKLPALHWPRAERGAMRFIPQSLLLRAVVLGFLAIVLLVPPGLAIVAASGVLPLTKVGALLFNIVFGAAVGIVMTRFVVLPALADGAEA